MSLLRTAGLGKTQPVAEAPQPEGSGRYLTLLANGISVNIPVIDDEAYKEFRSRMTLLERGIPDHLPDADKQQIIQEMIHALELYRKATEDELRERRNGWRTLTWLLLRYVLGQLGIDPASAEAAPLVHRVGSLLTGGEMQSYRILLTNFLRGCGVDNASGRLASPLGTDHSVANDNASGLRGGGAAVEHLKKLMEKNREGFVVLFRLGCMNVIGERFGVEAIQDSLMAVSAFLMHSLRNDDAIYHWSDSSLLAILESPAPPRMLQAAIARIVDSNREITIHVENHTVMVRVPLEFEIMPISHFKVGEDLYKLLPKDVKPW
jgi:GGDEF domain-containing protein